MEQEISTKSLNTVADAKWYIIHVYSGSESTVLNEIKQKIEDKGYENLVEELIVPVKEVTQLKKGKKVLVKKNFLPGYVLLKANLTEDLSASIRAIPRVSGFLGTKRIDGVPKPVSMEEINNILHNIQESATNTSSISAKFEVGDRAVISEGPFATFSGTVEEVEADKQKVKLSVSIFDRLVTVELNFDQLEKESAE